MIKLILLLLCVFNLFFAIISFVPCIMGGAMGMDSPQAQKDPFAITLSVLFLTFPVVCLVCGLALPVLQYFNYIKTGLIVGFFPLIEAAIVIWSLYVFGHD